MSKYLFLVEMDVPAELEGLFNELYDIEHAPSMLGVEGVQSCRRYRVIRSNRNGIARYAAMYDIDDPDLPASPAWRAAADYGRWKHKIRPFVSNKSHTLIEKTLDLKRSVS